MSEIVKQILGIPSDVNLETLSGREIFQAAMEAGHLQKEMRPVFVKDGRTISDAQMMEIAAEFIDSLGGVQALQEFLAAWSAGLGGTATVPATATAPKKRGRPAKVKVEGEATPAGVEPAAAPKKRGRPAKVKVEGEAAAGAAETATPEPKVKKERKPRQGTAAGSIPKGGATAMMEIVAAAQGKPETATQVSDFLAAYEQYQAKNLQWKHLIKAWQAFRNAAKNLEPAAEPTVQ